MNLPPAKYIEVTDCSLVLDIDLHPTHEAFAGHFPQKPILPGVVQIDWVMLWAKEQFDLSNAFASDIQVKFKDTIPPNKPLRLMLDYDDSKARLDFSYTSDDALMSKGRIKLVI